MTKTRTLSALAVIGLSVMAWPQASKPSNNVEAITASRLRAHLELIADDLLEGRDTPSRGLDFATLYVSTQLKLWGVKPAGDNGTYFQNIKITRPSLSKDESSIKVGDKSFVYGDGFTAATRAGDVQDAEIIFVGNGQRKPKQNIDPYKGLDVKGKILLVQEDRPNFRDVRSGDVEPPEVAGQKLGAKAVVVLTRVLSESEWQGRIRSSLRNGFPRIGGEDSSAQLPTVTLSEAAAKELLAGESTSYESIAKAIEEEKPVAPFSLKRKMSLKVVASDNLAIARNVVGIVPGSDPKLKDEYVAVGAHIDHVGMNGTGPGDHIWNGADDDGSGTVSILEMAHAFATGPRPKRSMIFVWHIGEEKGLWGSAYFTDHPTVPIEKIVGQLNIDMIGRNKLPTDKDPRNALLTTDKAVYIVGARRLSKLYGDLIDSANRSLYNLTFDLKYDDPKDPEHIYERSDHYNYARKGIPVAFFFTGLHADYHQPSDEVSKIDFPKMERICRTVFQAAWTIANNPTRPKLDAKPAGG